MNRSVPTRLVTALTVCLAPLAIVTTPRASAAEDAPPEKYDVVLLRPRSFLAAKASRADDAHTYLGIARGVAGAAGLKHHTLDDEDVLKAGLPRDEFLFCAYSPDLQGDILAKIGEFLDAGGHALFCYYLPDPVRARLGVGEAVYTAAGTEKRFAFVHPTAAAPKGIPASVDQSSWNAYVLAAVGAKARVAADWVAADGKTTTDPALVMTDEAAWFGHVFTRGDTEAKAQFLLSVIGAYDPTIWSRALPRVLAQLCRFRFAATPAELVAFAERQRPSLAARLVADEILGLQSRAVDGAEPWRAFARLTRLRQRTKNVYLRGFPSRPDRLRGVWVVSPNGIGDWGWEQTARRAKGLGLDALFVRIEWAGQAHYHSEVLPMAPGADEDPLRDAVAACHRHGLQIHAWFINHNWRTPPKAIIDKLSAEKRWQFGPDGKDRVNEGGQLAYWLNPAHPDNVKLQADMMAEVARNYAVDGVHFDYIRYENYTGSYGELDRSLFAQSLGRQVPEWPKDVLPKGDFHEQFCDWRCEQVSNVVRAASAAVRAANPRCQLSAAVYASWPAHRKLVGQDWARWLREGWLDFVCPMTYDAPSYYDRHVDHVKRQREAAANKPLFVGLGAWLHPDAVTIAEQVYQDRQEGADGFLLFSLDERLATEVLPDLRRGVFAAP
ncbi:MAG: hypothetical protein AUJ96_07590 [Armatimonadetes bacterium CG2_30_66_41]|nr:MAG: hypothetical protein AUJ96_07590 [Armatimonadetes bacterium CG2_30_66_41]